MNGAEDYGKRLAQQYPDWYCMPNQFDNDHNKHYGITDAVYGARLINLKQGNGR